MLNSERMDEIQTEQRAINTILMSWTVDMSEKHYYDLRNTLTQMLDYISDCSDVKPEINPLVAQYTPAPYKHFVVGGQGGPTPSMEE